MKSLKKLVFVFCFTALLPGLGHGQNMTAAETAELGVKSLLETVAESKEFFISDRDRYFSNIEEVLNSFVDFEAVARVVMASFADSATDEETERFAQILRVTLTRFYGASLVAYDGQELVFPPVTNTNPDPRADTIVAMELQGDTSFQLQYQMYLNENDEWKLKNLSLAGINLGRQYFTQFSALMTQHDDITVVLDNWK